MNTTKKNLELVISLDDMFLCEDEFFEIKGGAADSVNCGAGCGVGCGGGCGSQCSGCTIEEPSEPIQHV